MYSRIPQELHILFLAHGIIAFFLGMCLWVSPGRALTFVGWVPETYHVVGTDVSAPGTLFVDPILTRILGAVLLALALSSYRGWQAHRWSRVELLVELEAVFSFLALCVVLALSFFLGSPLLHTLRGWILLAVFGLFAIGFGGFGLMRSRSR